jgi:hypothetical protein
MLVCSIPSFLTFHACRRLQSGQARGEVVVDLGTESSHSVGKSMTREYATTDDLRKRSTGGISSLYLLSFLLTGNRKEAKQCFVAGLAGCVDGNPAFKKWANSWARRIIVHNAIQIKSPHVSQPGLETRASRSANEYTLPKNALRYAPFTSVLALEDFERFVYVLSVLEVYTDRNCAILLDGSVQEIVEARLRALHRIAEFANGKPPQLEIGVFSSQHPHFYSRQSARSQCSARGPQ